jgi:hypothetical protein
MVEVLDETVHAYDLADTKGEESPRGYISASECWSRLFCKKCNVLKTKRSAHALNNEH